MPSRREALLGGALGAALETLGLTAATAEAAQPPAAPASAAPGALLWAKRMFHMYTGPKGESLIREVQLPAPKSLNSQWLLRRPAERVTMGNMAPNYMMNFHVANQPNILIPLFGSLVVKLKDGSEWVFRHGDILFAEDCTGGGHMSGAGPEGCFSVSVQVPKTAHCLDTKAASDALLTGLGAPRY